MNILILTGKFGMGHWAASQSLRQQLLRGFPDASIAVEDLPAYVLPNISEALYKTFNLVVTYASHLFNTYYKLTSLGHPDAHPPLEGLFLDKLSELLEHYRPDAVIATHPLCAQMVSLLKEEYDLYLPLITCITDVSSHPEWINRNTDCYLVPSEEVRESLAAKGVDYAKICVTGIPVREEFRNLSRGRKVKNGELQPGRKEGTMTYAADDKERKSRFGAVHRELLVMGGGLGILPTAEGFYESLNAIPNIHVTIITGHNQKLFQRLAGRWENIQVIGYTDRVWEYMARADLIVTKPGGITLFESIFAQVPIFVWRTTLCQERNNARWLTQKGIGWVAEQEDCAEEIREILLDRRRLARAAACMGLVKEQLEVEGVNRLMAVIARSKGMAV